MKHIPLDPLYLLFEEQLISESVQFECEDEFVAHVVDKYMEELQSEGCLPVALTDSLREDLAAEVYEMLLKKTYGHFNLKSFLKSQEQQGS